MGPIESEINSRYQRFIRLLEFIGKVGVQLKYVGRVRRKNLLYHLEQCGHQSLGISLLVCFLMGMILAIQSGLQLQQFGSEIFVADLVGFSVIKELGPFMIAIIATGRAGSAFAAEISTMKIDDEIDALETLGMNSIHFLVIPKLLAMLIAVPLLTIFGDIAGLLGGMLVGNISLGIPFSAYYLRTTEVLYPMAFVLGVVKSVVYAILITLAGCWRGLEATQDARGVGQSTTSAVVSSVFLVVIADMILTLIYSTFGY